MSFSQNENALLKTNKPSGVYSLKLGCFSAT